MKRRSVSLLGIIVVLSVFVLWGCPKKTDVGGSGDSSNQSGSAKPALTPEQIKAEADAKAKAEADAKIKAEAEAKERAAAAAKEKEETERAAAAAAGLKPIFFDFDKSFVRSDAKVIMKKNAEWLKANPKVKVRIEGNADERGTKEYNQALGQRRASSAKKYLTDLGISAKRISLISYGKEKPTCSDATETCWQKNRRDDLVAVTE